MKQLPRVLAFILYLSSTLAVAASDAIDEWYEMSMMDAPAGWMHVVGQVEDDGHRTIVNQTSMHMKRGAMEVSISIQVEWVETAKGSPVSMTMRQDMSGQRVTTIWAFKGDAIEITSEQDGRRSTSTVKVPEGTWYTPWSLLDETRRRMEAGEIEFTLGTMQPDMGIKIIQVHSKKSGAGTIDQGGTPTAVTTWDVTNNAIPFPSTVSYDAEGLALQTTMRAPFGEIIMKLSDRDAALASIEGSTMPELMESLMVPVDRPIPDWKTARRASFKLIPRTGDVPGLPSAGYQRVGPVAEDGSVVLDVDLDVPSVATAEDQANSEYLGKSVLVDPTDTAILELARTSIKDAGKDPARKAEALREAVFLWISRKNYGTVFASASETVRNRTGDCSEHGVLLAALLRSEGIPARLASGAVYVPAGVFSDEPVFGWHMWTQAIIDGHWVDLDATLPVPYTVGHLLADTSSLSDDKGMASEQWNLLSMLGNLGVDVISVDGSSPPKP